MTSTRLVLTLSLSCLIAPISAVADPHRGHHHGRGEYKEEFWDGHCKVERKYKRNGDYKEERKCKGAPAVVYQPQVIHAPAPVFVQPAPVMVQPAPVMIEPVL